jgi:hypothetical protein
MAKKQRVAQRAPRSASPTRYSQGTASTGTPANTTSATGASSSARSASGRGLAARGAKASVPVDYAKEYGHVASDLRRVGLLAASLFAVIVILSFVVR